MRAQHIETPRPMAAISPNQNASVPKLEQGAALAILALLLAMPAMSGAATVSNVSREEAIQLVTQIQRADYEGDRGALKRLPLKLLPFAENKDLAVKVRYWRGFALWRRAINGFNESPTPTDLESDLQDAITEFEKATTLDPDFADAKIAVASCLGNLLYLHRNDPVQVQTYIARISPILRDLKISAPENPRLYWVLGPVYWNTPVEHGGGQDKAFDAYQRGLDLVRHPKGSTGDPLEPSWGEPELLMNLAWSNLNRTLPDLNAAERYAQAALALVPDWHYVRYILMPKIQEAKEGRKSSGSYEVMEGTPTNGKSRYAISNPVSGTAKGGRVLFFAFRMDGDL